MLGRRTRILILVLLFAVCFSSFANDGADEEECPVVSIRIEDADSTFAVKIGQGFEVRLPVVPGTGYSWHIAISDSDLLSQVGESEFQTVQTEDTLGSSEEQVFRFEALQQGSTELVLVERRSWEKDSIRSFTVTICID